jgi:hypothetical protein
MERFTRRADRQVQEVGVQQRVIAADRHDDTTHVVRNHVHLLLQVGGHASVHSEKRPYHPSREVRSEVGDDVR